MVLHHHFTSATLSNTYLVGADSTNDVILVDPTSMDVQLLRLIEGRNSYVRQVLMTHTPTDGLGAVSTLLKIYDAELYGSAESFPGFACSRVSDGDHLHLSGLEIEVIDVSGLADGTLMFRCGFLLFSGDLLGAGKLLPVRQRALRHRLAMVLGERLARLDPRTLVLPAAGPPSTVGAELAFNPSLRASGSPP